MTIASQSSSSSSATMNANNSSQNCNGNEASLSHHGSQKRKRSSTGSSSSLLFLDPDSDSEYNNNELDRDNDTVNNKSLLDDDIDDDPDDVYESFNIHNSINKKRRLNSISREATCTSGNLTATSTSATSIAASSTSTTSWQDFCRQGKRFKTLLDDALVKVANSAAAGTSDGAVSSGNKEQELQDMNAENEDDENGDTASMATTAITRNKSSFGFPISLLQQIAQETKTENLVLKQKLQSEQSNSVTLQALLDDLRSTKQQQEQQITKLTMALHRASQNATQAREDADAAESTAAAMAVKVEALETVVQETKRASQLLLEEQEQVTHGAQSMGTKYVNAQTELARSNAIQQKLQSENRKMSKRYEQLQQQIEETSQKLEEETNEKMKWKRQTEELQLKEKLMEERIERLETELQESKSLLVDATSTAAETKEAKQVVQTAFNRMEEANQQLHKQLHENQQQLKKEKELHQQSLAEVQKEHQSVQQKLQQQRDLTASLNLEKQTADKKIVQLQTKLGNLERRLHDSTNLMSVLPSGVDSTNTNDGDDDGLEQSNNTKDQSNPFSIPRLGTKTSNEKENPPSQKCSICLKDASGLMKKCECRREKCQYRAHVMCVHKITSQAGKSVSHPGTPAPKLPVVLCANNTTNAASTLLATKSHRKSSIMSTTTAPPVTPAGPSTAVDVSETNANHRASF